MTKKEKEKEVSRHYRFVKRCPLSFVLNWNIKVKYDFRLVHQILSLTGINFQTKSIIGYVHYSSKHRLIFFMTSFQRISIYIVNFIKGMWS